MEKFTSSFGSEVYMEGGALYIGNPPLSPLTRAGVQALREFFLHERDTELGRWRWPENPDYVVVQDHSPERYVVVMRDSTGSTYGVGEGDQPSADIPWRDCAKAYFAAHPVSKPWHDAKHDEIWVLRQTNSETWLPFRWDAAEQWWFASSSNGAMHRRDESEITDARRIWPEVPSE